MCSGSGSPPHIWIHERESEFYPLGSMGTTGRGYSPVARRSRGSRQFFPGVFVPTRNRNGAKTSRPKASDNLNGGIDVCLVGISRGLFAYSWGRNGGNGGQDLV